MKFVDDKRTWLTKLGIGTALVLVGVVIAVVGVVAILILNQPSREELEATMRQESVDYIKSEQVRLGINCNDLGTTIGGFLEKDIKPVLNVHQAGRNWYKDINADVRKRIEKLRYNYSDCGRLYSQAQHASWDGLNGFKYTLGLEAQLAVLNALIRFEFCDVHDAKCLDQGFRELHDAVTKIEARLALVVSK